jgi:hypothetical protein
VPLQVYDGGSFSSPLVHHESNSAHGNNLARNERV